MKNNMKIDIGCGYSKQPGYIGVDRYKTTDATITCDFNKTIPFEDNSVERVIMSHSLEHCDDIIHTMQEVYRVCEHKAIVCIVAPYYNTSLNIANPYHKQVLNEHTARFFTTSNYTCVGIEDYDFPHANKWGLGESDNSNLQMDFRCVKMELFYFPEYRRLSAKEQREARKKYADVADQIMYHFVAVKEEITTEELDLISQDYLEEPNYVTIRRYKERYEDLDIITQQKEIGYIKQLEEYKEAIAEFQEQVKQVEIQRQTILELQENNDSLQDEVRQLHTEAEEINTILQKKQHVIKQQNELIQDGYKEKAVLSEKIGTFSQILRQSNQDLGFKPIDDLIDVATAQKALEEYSNNYAELKSLVKINMQSLCQENNALKYSKFVKLKDRLLHILDKKAGDLSALINDECKEVVDISILNAAHSLKDYALQQSKTIDYNEILFYSFTSKTDTLSSIEVIFSNVAQFLNDQSIVIGAEILDENMSILRTVWLSNKQIKHNLPTEVTFNTITHAKFKNYTVRFVGVHESMWGISIYEWIKYDILGKKKDSVLCAKIS